MCPLVLRRETWRRLESDLDRGKLATMTSEIGLADVITTAPRIVEGKVRGRLLVKIR
jgi:acrylyl-CoA reductase (NADPH)